MQHQKHAPQTNKKLIFNTPGRECAHADRGCCPKCFIPIQAGGGGQNNMTFHLGRRLMQQGGRA